MEIRWVTHAWFQIKTGDTVLQIDPSDLDSKPLDPLPIGIEKADIVLISHHHSDHCRKDMIALVSKQGTHILAPRLCSEKLEGGLILIRSGESFHDDGVIINAVDAYNTPEGNSTVKSHKKRECLGFLITAEGKTIYHAGDTDIIPEMASFGPLDVAIIPIGGTYTMDVNEAVKAIEIMKPKTVIPMHAIDADPRELVQKVKNDSRVVILKKGESLTV